MLMGSKFHNNKSTNAIIFYGLLFTYKLLLDIACLVVEEEFSFFTKFTLQPTLVKIVESYIALMVVGTCMPKENNRLSVGISWFLVLLGYVPILSYFAMTDASREWCYVNTVFWVLTLIASKYRWLNIKFKYLKNSGLIRNLIFLAITLYSYIVMYIYFGFSFNLDLSIVYDIRETYVELRAPLVAYTFNWCAYIINPLMMIMALTRRKYIIAAFAVILQLLLFSATGFKVYLFSIALVIFLPWFVINRYLFVFLSGGLIVLIVSGLATYLTWGDLWVSGILIDRLLIIPSQITYHHFDFFSQNELIYLSYSILSPFIKYPYNAAPWFLISDVYYDTPNASANAGMIADAYMNFGYMGLLFLSLGLILVFNIVDQISKEKDYRLVVTILIIPILSLINGGLLTAILTSGLGLGLLVAYLLPKSVKKHFSEGGSNG